MILCWSFFCLRVDEGLDLAIPREIIPKRVMIFDTFMEVKTKISRARMKRKTVVHVCEYLRSSR